MKYCKYFYRRTSDAEACCIKGTFCPYKGILEACPDYEPKEIQNVIQPNFNSDTDWEQVRIQAAIAAMPIANNIVDNLYSADYHGTEVSKLHSIERFTQECVAIADALVEELKKEK